MKLYKNVLSPTTLNVVHRELNNFIESEDKWTPSIFKWKEDIRVNISGAVLITSVSNGISELILEDIEYILPETSKLSVQYCVYAPNSGISLHTDGKYKFGATIYLNEFWDPNDGGIFLYENNQDDWRAHIPEFNTLMINTNGIRHMVTPVSPFAKHNRYTIQIFGEKENE